MKPLYLLQLQGCPIFQQLQLEEALLRADQRNWCLLNEGTPPAIVMGISGKVEELIDPFRLKEKALPIIRRFSGGGTVVVDENTFFSTLIFNQEDAEIPCCSKKILNWTQSLYHPVFEDLDFQIKENDYALGNKKFGGNAQYIRRGRWLHHSSLLWDYDPEKMNYLLLPPKIPAYRNKRDHGEFLCTLKPHIAQKEQISQKIIRQLQTQFDLHPVPHEEILQILERPHRQATSWIIP